MSGIRVRRLLLRGVSKDYEVGSLADGGVRPLSVIAGEISTGKTSVLELIDYHLGASRHPRHPDNLMWLAFLPNQRLDNRQLTSGSTTDSCCTSTFTSRNTSFGR